MLSYGYQRCPCASKLSIDPINSHASYIGKSTGSNKRSVPINRTVSSNWNQRVNASYIIFKVYFSLCRSILHPEHSWHTLFVVREREKLLTVLTTTMRHGECITHTSSSSSYFKKVPTTAGGGVIWELLLRACESRQERRLKLLSWSYKLKKSPDSLVRARLSASTEDFWLNNISWGPATTSTSRGAFSNIYYTELTQHMKRVNWFVLFFLNWNPVSRVLV